ncbi:protein indeterminate-domain 5, chloroplastic [Trifolium repens]|nr:protein indeterminate-domain 5, chloroplastic [Trifolium repens]
MAASSSSASLFGFRDEDPNPMKQQHSLPPSSSATPAAVAAAPSQKKKRNQPGTPNPDAEVIALSPKTLMATNRFICEVCNKGFQREQNLQLHRRGHNLPWKLKQKTTKEPKRKVYLCPEPTCVHHDPSRALGDLTGIKKHFSRKHGEKKWKCDKCSKKYAVQSDWKAHSKTCGTREYRCDCGTLFSRRDSFITHRAFCDALAQEGPRQPPITLPGAIGSHLYGSTSNTMGLNLSHVAPQMSNMHQQQDHHSNSATDILRLGASANRTGQFDHHNILPTTFRPNNSFFNSNNIHDPNQNYVPDQGLMMQQNNSNNNNNLFNIPNFLSSNNSATTNTNSSNNSFSEHLNVNNNEGTNFFTGSGGTSSAPSSLFSTFPQGGGNSNINAAAATSIASMSATALLQKAAQMGATSSNGNGTTATSLLKSFGNNAGSNSASSGGGGGEHNRQMMSGGGGGSGNYGFGGGNEQSNLHDLMNSFAATGNSSIFETGGGGVGLGSGGGDSRQMTRDFLGVGQIVRSMSGAVGGQREHAAAFNLPGSLEGDQRNNINAAASFGRGGGGGGAGGNFQ